MIPPAVFLGAYPRNSSKFSLGFLTGVVLGIIPWVFPDILAAILSRDSPGIISQMPRGFSFSIASLDLSEILSAVSLWNYFNSYSRNCSVSFSGNFTRRLLQLLFSDIFPVILAVILPGILPKNLPRVSLIILTDVALGISSRFLRDNLSAVFFTIIFFFSNIPARLFCCCFITNFAEDFSSSSFLIIF